MPGSAHDAATVEIDGRRVALSNLDRILYPGSGTTKGEVLAYVTAAAPALLAQLAGRPVTRVRWPHGTGGASFFEKNVPQGCPEWVRTVRLPAPGSSKKRETITYPLAQDLSTLVYLTNLAALELHVHQWRVDDEGRPLPPDRLVVDLDPGPGAGLTECARVAVLVADALREHGLEGVVPVTSGSKGLQLYAPAPPATGDDPDAPRTLAHEIATRLSREHPDLVVAKMTKSLREGRVLLDWSQNTRAKTTICPYSLRGKGPAPTVAAPRTWDEIDDAAAGRASLSQLRPDEVLRRLEAGGDPLAALA